MSQQIFKICKLEFNNFRSIDHVVINNIDNITILVGPNEGGKSNILNAIAWSFSDKELSRDDTPTKILGKTKKNNIIADVFIEILNPNEYITILSKRISEELENLVKSDMMHLTKQTFKEIRFLRMQKRKDGSRFISFYDSNFIPLSSLKLLEENLEIEFQINLQNIDTFQERIRDIFSNGLLQLMDEKHVNYNVNNLAIQIDNLLKNQHFNQMTNYITEALRKIVEKHSGESTEKEKYKKEILKEWRTFSVDNIPKCIRGIEISSSRILVIISFLFFSS